GGYNGGDQPIEKRVEGDGDDRTGNQGVHRGVRENVEASSQGGEDEGEFPDLGQGDGNRQGDLEGVAQRQDDPQGGQRLAQQDDRQRGRHQPGGLRQR